MVIRRSMEFMCIVFFMSIFYSSCICIGSDTISTGQSLFRNQTLISKEGEFELGFFTPGISTNYYVGIWYRNISVHTVVWVANRNTPIQSVYSNCRLVMSNGSLHIYVNLEKIWTLEGASDATEATILDTGNLVLRNVSGIIIWQSFEYPTDTWMPGGKVGFRWGSDMVADLVSWKNPGNPAFGNYSLGLKPNGESQLFMRSNRFGNIWSSGVLEGGTFASFLDNSRFRNSYNFTYVPGYYSVYLIYNVYNESMKSRIVMDNDGLLKQFVWSDANQDWVTNWLQPFDCTMCGPNTICNTDTSPICSCLNLFEPRAPQDWEKLNFSMGCVKCTDVNPEFVRLKNVKLPDNPKARETNDHTCEQLCSADCSCKAYANNRLRGCLLFMGDIMNLVILPNYYDGADLYIRMESKNTVPPPREKVPPPGEKVPPGEKGKRNIPLLIIAAPLAATILVSCFGLYCLWQKLKSKESQGTEQNLLLLDLNSSGPAYNKHTSSGTSQGNEKNNLYELPIFSFPSIDASTNKFSMTNKLGEGGFGPVYKGELLNGQFVAVKRLSRMSGQGLEEFRNETELIAKLQHRNLVGILGCCIEKDEKILVYEYMPNKSLDFFLFEPTKKEILDWKRRVHIIEGIAQGLLYLHHYSRLRIVHRDLKASNILLDADMNPKISDFGMARIFGGNILQANTERIVGTYGYMSPEYAMDGHFSVKSDVFAFGVLMLEIISGKKNTGFYGSDHLSLLGYAWNMWTHDRVLELVDPILEITSSSTSTPLKYIQIGLLCVQESAANRPLMLDVVAMLNNEQTEVASPQHPAFTVGRTLAKANPRDAKVCSINDLTLTHMEAR